MAVTWRPVRSSQAHWRWHVAFIPVILGWLAAMLCLVPAASAHPSATAPTRPDASVASARVALVRVLTYYYGDMPGGPVPLQTACAADGVLVGTTGNGLNSFSYVLLPTSVVNPSTPCQGVRAAFSELYGAPSDWGIISINVALTAAYTGTNRLGTVTYTIDPATITTTGGPGSPALLALPLSPASGAPTHDLPVLQTPQASDAPATGPAYALDLTGSNGQELGTDALPSSDATATLYPIAVSTVPLRSSLLPASTAAAAPAATSTSAATSTASADHDAATALLDGLSIGSPIIDSNGRLIGMVVNNGTGHHVLLPEKDVASAIGAVTGKPGPLTTSWQQGLAAYYAQPPDFVTASSVFHKMETSYPDFAGVKLFASAADAKSTSIVSLTHAATATPTPAPVTSPATHTAGGDNGRGMLLAMTGGAVLVLLLVVVVGVVIIRRARRASQLGIMPDEAGLDLLPRESMYGVPAMPEEAPTNHIPALSTVPVTGSLRPAVPDAPTLDVPAMRAAPSSSRLGVSLVAYAAGLADPGVKRANEPNQDNLLALHGARIAGARTQPYGLFIVADGMGGHDHGQEASRLAIETVANVIMHALTSQQPLDAATVDNLVRAGVAQAHDELRRKNQTYGDDMGTTITAALVLDDVAYVANIGDSRTYLMSPDAGLRRVTTDHSVVASLAAAGVIRPEDIYHHPRRNQIYRSLGGEGNTIDVDVFTVPLQAGDKLLLCSDGLWEMVRDPQIEHILRATADPQQAVQLLVREANTNGGEDNIAALVVRMVEERIPVGQPSMRVLARPDGTTTGRLV